MNKNALHRLLLSKRLEKRDGMHCHYCSAPLVPNFIYKRLQSGTAPNKKNYREASNALANGARVATFDHKTPKALGGRLTLDNTVLACEGCNVEKGKQDYSKFIQTKRAAPAQYASA